MWTWALYKFIVIIVIIVVIVTINNIVIIVTSVIIVTIVTHYFCSIPYAKETFYGSTSRKHVVFSYSFYRMSDKIPHIWYTRSYRSGTPDRIDLVHPIVQISNTIDRENRSLLHSTATSLEGKRTRAFRNT